MHGVVVRKRGRVGETIPISAMFRAKVSQTSEDRAVESLNLTIRLRMIGCREQLPNTQDSANILEELGGEFPAVIGNKIGCGPIVKHPMSAESLFDVAAVMFFNGMVRTILELRSVIHRMYV